MSRSTRTAGRWVPSKFVAASIALHLGAGISLLARPRAWPIALGAIAADHLLLAAAGLWPKSRLLGPNWTRLPAASALRRQIAITVDDGPDPDVTARVLSIFDEFHARATFFCIGERVERHPDLAQDIVRRGHAIENHSHGHPLNFSLLGPAALHAQVARAQDCIVAATGERPAFFRAPAGLRNPFLVPVVARLGLRRASWTRRGFDTVNREPDDVLGRLTRGLAGGDILLLHDGNAARADRGSPVILEVLPRLLAAARDLGFTPVTLRAALLAT